MQSRRTFLRAAGPFALGLAGIRVAIPLDGSRLAVRPRAPTKKASPGVHTLQFEAGRKALLFVPKGYRADRPAGLLLMLHGATQDAEFSIEVTQDAAAAHNLVVLAPKSRNTTWDAIREGFGPDVGYIDRVMAETFARCAIQPSRVVAAGFSDGASYALSLGLANGDLFQRIVAFSPGFIVGSDRVGKPLVWVSHGTRDRILPIDQTSRRLVPELKRDGYSVEFREFDGPHWVPREISEEAMTWIR
ncbi:MAG: phospholipase [Gemmatimonadales bacterium]|nr:phospholipase [Gemmatimonadales bacterium]